MSLTRLEKISLAVMALCAAIAIAGFLFGNFLPTITGRVFPVTSPLEILKIEEVKDARAQSRVEGTASKQRDCNFIGVEWNLGQRGGRFAGGVYAEFRDKPEIREKGPQYWRELFIDLTPSQIINSSFGDVWHDCGLPWYVRTPFYDGKA